MSGDEDDLEREAEWRWGESPAFQESKRRTSRYGPADWAQLRAEGGRLGEALGAAKRRGLAPDSKEAMDLAELNREYNSRWFYETDHAMHARLAEGYVSDPRFTATYDNIESGLAAWYAKAIIANGKRAGADLSRDSALSDLRQTMGLSSSSPDLFANAGGKEARRAKEQEARAEHASGRRKK